MNEEIDEMIFNLEFRLLILNENLKQLELDIEQLHQKALRFTERFSNTEEDW
jgi:hypothetical protein